MDSSLKTVKRHKIIRLIDTLRGTVIYRIGEVLKWSGFADRAVWSGILHTSLPDTCGTELSRNRVNELQKERNGRVTGTSMPTSSLSVGPAFICTTRGEGSDSGVSRWHIWDLRNQVQTIDHRFVQHKATATEVSQFILNRKDSSLSFFASVCVYDSLRTQPLSTS